MIVATLFVYRSHRAGPVPEGVFRMPGYPVLPVLFVAVSVFIVISTFRSNALNSTLGAVLILAGIPVFLVWRKRK